MLDAHLMAQVAACRTGAGVALWPNPRVLELRGAPLDLEASGWCLRQTANRMLYLVDRRDRSPVEFGPDVAVTDVSPAYSAVILAGPLAAALAMQFADPVMVAVDSDHHVVVVVETSRATEAARALLQAGQRFGAVAVELRATDLHRAAQPLSHLTLGAA